MNSSWCLPLMDWLLMERLWPGCERRECPIISAPGGPMDMGCLYVNYIGCGESESSKCSCLITRLALDESALDGSALLSMDRLLMNQLLMDRLG